MVFVNPLQAISPFALSFAKAIYCNCDNFIQNKKWLDPCPYIKFLTTVK